MGLRFLPDPSGSGEASAERSVSVFTAYRVSGSPPGTMRRISTALHEAQTSRPGTMPSRSTDPVVSSATRGGEVRRRILARPPTVATSSTAPRNTLRGGAVGFFCVQRDLRRRERGAHVVDRGDSEAIRPDDSELAGGRPQDPDALLIRDQ